MAKKKAQAGRKTVKKHKSKKESKPPAKARAEVRARAEANAKATEAVEAPDAVEDALTVVAPVSKLSPRVVEVMRRMGFARTEACKAWTLPQTEKKDMDVDLAEAFAMILMGHMYTPHLGCATTRQLLAELKARAELGQTLDYSTVPQL